MPQSRKRKVPEPDDEITSLTKFEGGDVILYPVPGSERTIVFVGISHPRNVNGGASTTIGFANALQAKYPQPRYVVHPVHLQPRVLHLDLVFNILPFNFTDGRPMCILYKEGLTAGDAFSAYLETLGLHVEIVDENAASDFVCNFINTGPNKMIASNSSSMRNLEKKWREYNKALVITLIPFKDVYENLGGSIRCSTLPIIRENKEGITNTFNVINEVDPLLVCMVGKLTSDKDSKICVDAVKDVGNADRPKMLRKIGEQLEGLVFALQTHGVTVLRPNEEALARVTACNAIFARDGLLVIGHDVLKSDLHLPHRRDEYIPYMESITTYFSAPRVSPRGPVFAPGVVSSRGLRVSTRPSFSTRPKVSTRKVGGSHSKSKNKTRRKRCNLKKKI